MPAFDYGYTGAGPSPINPGYTAPILNNPFPTFDKPSPAPSTTISYNPASGPVGNAPINRPPFPNLQGPSTTPTGSLNFSFGGGSGGAPQYSSVPSGVLNERQFAPYSSTYTPPTPATPDPYNYATRDPYSYGDGLSNAGAAYDIWGSKPGTNPYVLSQPADFDKGLMGLRPITMPGNVPSTNTGANIGNGGGNRQKFTGTAEQIIRDYGYFDRTAPMQNNVPPSMRDSAPNAGVMLASAAKNVSSGIYPDMQSAMDAQVAFSKKYPATSPAENKNLISQSQKMMETNYSPPVQRPAKDTSALKASQNTFGSGGSRPGQTTYTAKKSSTKAAVANYTSKKAGTISRPAFTPNYDATKGPLRF